MTFEEKAEIVINQLRADRDRLLGAIEKIRAEIADEKIDIDLDIGQEIHYNRAIDDVLAILDKYAEQEPTIGQLFSCEEVEELRNKIWKQVEQEPKTGHWIEHNTGHSKYYSCSKCSCLAPNTEVADGVIWKLSKYCPDCGARMIEPQERGDKE